MKVEWPCPKFLVLYVIFNKILITKMGSVPKRPRDGDAAPVHHMHAHQGFSRVDKETLAYFQEIDSHLKSLEDEEEKHLLAGNVLEGVLEKEVDVVTDAACSRVLEALLPWAGVPTLCAFAAKCLEGENLGTICTR
jgi:hypothetical protein